MNVIRPPRHQRVDRGVYNVYQAVHSKYRGAERGLAVDCAPYDKQNGNLLRLYC